MSTKWISVPVALAALCCCMMGCGANRFQHAADKSLLIQENLQLDQALSITQYELMRAQQENDALRKQLEEAGSIVTRNSSQNPGNMSGGTSGGVTSGRMPPLRSQYDTMGTAPAFNANDPNLPSPTNQLPHHLQRPQQNAPPEITPPQSANGSGNQTDVSQASATQYANVPPGAPQWSPQRR